MLYTYEEARELFKRPMSQSDTVSQLQVPEERVPHETYAHCRTCRKQWSWELYYPREVIALARGHAKRNRGHQVVIHTYEEG